MTSAYARPTPIWTDFIFQAMFAATAATIVSGAVAERVKLTQLHDLRRHSRDLPLPDHRILEVGLRLAQHHGLRMTSPVPLWFTPSVDSPLSLRSSFLAPAWANTPRTASSRSFPTTCHWPTSACSCCSSAGSDSTAVRFLARIRNPCPGCLSPPPWQVSPAALRAMFTSWIVLKKPDLSMGSQRHPRRSCRHHRRCRCDLPLGCGCWWAPIAGVIVVFSVLFFDKIRIDDPVGAVSVHGVCGIWGTLASGIFGRWQHRHPVDRHGCSISAFAFVSSFILFYDPQAHHGCPG